MGKYKQQKENRFGKNNPNWKGDKGKKQKTYYCKIEGCYNKINPNTALYGSGLCKPCAMKERFKYPENCPNWKGGETANIHYCKDVKCNNKINYTTWRYGDRSCISCAKRRLYKNPKRHPNWRGGITLLCDKIRHLQEYKQWRSEIFKRDNYTCRECGYNKGGNLESHHIKAFAVLLQEFLTEYNQFSPIEDKETLVRLAMKWKPFWDINNGKTLCKNCHKHIRKVNVNKN